MSCGTETTAAFDRAAMTDKLNALTDEDKYGIVLRAKGILCNAAGEWFQFDYVPGESQFRPGSADYTGRICVIGVGIDIPAIKGMFGL